MPAPTKHTNYQLSKLEEQFKQLGYKIRYEKGNFKSGSCLIEESKVIVINKFASLDVKIGFLSEILKSIDLSESLMTDADKNLFSEQ